MQENTLNGVQLPDRHRIRYHLYFIQRKLFWNGFIEINIFQSNIIFRRCLTACPFMLPGLSQNICSYHQVTKTPRHKRKKLKNINLCDLMSLWWNPKGGSFKIEQQKIQISDFTGKCSGRMWSRTVNIIYNITCSILSFISEILFSDPFGTSELTKKRFLVYLKK